MYDESASFAPGPSSMPPPSSNEVFSSQAAGLNGMTPSPSPPSAPGSQFVPYNPHPVEQNASPNDHRAQSQFATPFYSIPPPMPVSPHGMHGGSHGGNTLPRLDPMIMPQFASRVSPSVHSPTTPVTASSPLSSHFSAPSYEREKQRDKERERPTLQTTISAERKY